MRAFVHRATCRRPAAGAALDQRIATGLPGSRYRYAATQHERLKSRLGVSNSQLGSEP
jgi:hypothetical protein